MRVAGDDRRALVSSNLERRIEPVLETDEPIDPDHHCVRGPRVVRIVPGQLEPGHDDHPVALPGAQRLFGDCEAVRREGRRRHHPALPDDVIGDAQHVEPRAAVQIDHVGEFELAVTPPRMRVQLAQQSNPQAP